MNFNVFLVAKHEENNTVITGVIAGSVFSVLVILALALVVVRCARRNMTTFPSILRGKRGMFCLVLSQRWLCNFFFFLSSYV